MKLKTENEKLQVIVQDTGIGMTVEEAKNIFDRQFERGKEAKKVYSLGRGIGLFLAASIIKEHKGRTWVESPGPGKGSTFYVEPAGEVIVFKGKGSCFSGSGFREKWRIFPPN